MPVSAMSAFGAYLRGTLFTLLYNTFYEPAMRLYQFIFGDKLDGILSGKQAISIPPKSVCVITGGNTGLGYHTAVLLARMGMTVVIGVRSVDTGVAAVAAIKKESANIAADVSAEVVDLSSLASTRAFATVLKNKYADRGIARLICNAGGIRETRQLTAEDKMETNLEVNYLSHFLLIHELTPLLQKAKARVISISSIAHWAGIIDLDDMHTAGRTWQPLQVYGATKLMQIMMTHELTRRRQRNAAISNISFVAVHPGTVATRFYARSKLIETIILPIIWLVGKTPANGARTQVWAALTTQNIDDKYLADCDESSLYTADSVNEELAGKLYQKRLELCGMTKGF